MATKALVLGGKGGVKSIPLDQITNWADWGLPWQGEPGKDKPAAHLAGAVGYLFRSIELRANAVAAMPWSIYRGTGTEPLWDSEEPQPPDALASLADLPELLGRIEAALCLGARAYLHKERNRVVTTGVRWLDPSTMEPVWTPQGIAGFRRYANGATVTLTPDEVVYIWLRGLSETEPKVPPAQAGAAAANILYNKNVFAKAYFERGAVKSGLLTVDGTPLPAERERLKSWWQRFMSGLGNAFNAEVVSAAVTYVPVGEGLAELTNRDLTDEQREDIATALGVPHSLVMSNAANYATAEADTKNFFENTIVPECRLIERQLNAQLFTPLKLNFRFNPQTLDVFQKDENERASALAAYVNAGFKLSVAAQMLGLELPEGIEYEDLDPDPAEVAQMQRAMAGEPEEPDDDEDARAEERKRFERWAKRRKYPDPADFKSTILTDAEKEALLGEMRAPFPATFSDYP